MLSYIGKFSYEKRRAVLETIRGFAEWLEGRGVYNKVSALICDTREQKAEIAEPLEPALAVDDSYEIVESYDPAAVGAGAVQPASVRFALGVGFRAPLKTQKPIRGVSKN